jgi:hypothetical protein
LGILSHDSLRFVLWAGAPIPEICLKSAFRDTSRLTEDARRAARLKRILTLPMMDALEDAALKAIKEKSLCEAAGSR